jgi:hypothetical protein
MTADSGLQMLNLAFIGHGEFVSRKLSQVAGRPRPLGRDLPEFVQQRVRKLVDAFQTVDEGLEPDNFLDRCARWRGAGPCQFLTKRPQLLLFVLEIPFGPPIARGDLLQCRAS